MGWNNQSVELIILTEQTSGFSGIFGYSPQVGTGNLIFSVAAAAGTDPYGNAYPQGISGLGSLTLFGPDSTILVYSGVPAAGNLIASFGSAGTDAYGNKYVEGQGFYDATGPTIEIRPDLHAMLVYEG